MSAAVKTLEQPFVKGDTRDLYCGKASVLCSRICSVEKRTARNFMLNTLTIDYRYAMMLINPTLIQSDVHSLGFSSSQCCNHITFVCNTVI